MKRKVKTSASGSLRLGKSVVKPPAATFKYRVKRREEDIKKARVK